jgi:hypothetical protein
MPTYSSTPPYQFGSPLAAAGSALTDLLAQRKAEQRQKMLDDIAAQDAESMRASRQAQIEMSQAQTEMAQERAELERMNAFLAGNPMGTEVPEDSEFLDILRKFNRVQQGSPIPTPGVNTGESYSFGEAIEESDTADKWFIRGTIEEQERERLAGLASNYANTLDITDPRQKTAYDQIMASLATESGMPDISSMFAERFPAVIFDEPTGQLRQDSSVTTPTQPLTFTTPARDVRLGHAPKAREPWGETPEGLPIIFDPNDSTFYITNVDGTLRPYAGEVMTRYEDIGRPVSLIDPYSKAAGQAVEADSTFFNEAATKGADTTANILEAGIGTMTNASLRVKQRVNETMEGALPLGEGDQENFSVEEIVAAYVEEAELAGESPWTPKEISDATDLLTFRRTAATATAPESKRGFIQRLMEGAGYTVPIVGGIPAALGHMNRPQE